MSSATFRSTNKEQAAPVSQGRNRFSADEEAAVVLQLTTSQFLTGAGFHINQMALWKELLAQVLPGGAGCVTQCHQSPDPIRLKSISTWFSYGDIETGSTWPYEKFLIKKSGIVGVGRMVWLTGYV